MEELIGQYIREMKLSAGFNRQRIFEAWDAVSGASRYTLDRFYRDGMLYCTISSSVVRNQLYFQRDVLVQKMNEYLEKDEMLVRDGKDEPIIKNLILFCFCQIMKIFADTAYVRTGGSPEELRCARYLQQRCADMGLEVLSHVTAEEAQQVKAFLLPLQAS